MRLVSATKMFGGLLALGLGITVASCGDDAVNPNNRDITDVPLFDGNDGFPETEVTDTTIPDTRDTVDTNTPETNPPDLVPDLTPPSVVSTSPAAGASDVALPLDITIVFSEPLFATTVATQSIKLFDWLGQEVPGAPVLQADGKTVKWRPTTNNQQLVSAYTIKVMANIIADQVGNKLANTEEFTFTTSNYANQEGYRTLAAKYAPNIYSTVDSNDSPQLQVPVKFDGDGDWNLINNRPWIVAGATSLVPAVYYTVTETYTHYYVNYSYYFPYVNHNVPDYTTGNGNVGVLVVVEKARGLNAGSTAERPALAYTYWKEGTGEEQYAFASDESGIVSSGGADDWGLKATFAQETLFPGGRFESYITAKTHRSCNWNWNQGGTVPPPPCGLPGAVKNGDVLVFKYLGGSPTEVKKKDNAWPTDMSDVDGQPEAFGYALVPLYSTLWPRRTLNDPDTVFETTTFTYEADADRPGNGTKLSGAFQQSLSGANLSSFGKPIWAYGWNPSICGPNDLCTRIKKGQIAIDPAWYVWERHQRSNNANSLVTYDPATGAGHSLTYCFNGFVALDVRGTDPKCGTP